METEILHGSSLSGLDRCPQCGIANPLLEFQSIFFDAFRPNSLAKFWVSYKCSSCDDIVAACGFAQPTLRQSQFPQPFLSQKYVAMNVIPRPVSIDEDLPNRPKIYLTQALSSLHAPDGAIMLAGSAIDSMLKLKGYLGGSVYERIEQAVNDHVLTSDMREWAHAVRLEANKPRHADLDDPHATPERAKQVIEFAKALGDFLFVFPARIARGTEQAGQTD